MIPKKIHYCWFGRGEKPKLAKKCIVSWKKYCPDYEIIEWNEDNFDVNYNGYTRYCYENKKWAFLSDFVRLLVVEKYGGLYFDTDVELLKSLDFLLNDEAFFGFETAEYIASGLGFGSVAHGAAIQSMINEYASLLDGKHGVKGCPRLNTSALIPYRLRQDGSMQIVAGARLYPVEYFNPYESSTGRLSKTSNTVSIHWYSAAWLSKGKQLRLKIMRPLHRIFGVEIFKRFRK